MMLTVNWPDAGRVAGQDPNLGGCSRSTRHHVPFDERVASEQAVVSRSKEVAADPEEVVDDSVHGRKMLQMGG